MTVTFGVDRLCWCKGSRPECYACRGTGLITPPRARNSDPETSHEAAESITSDKIRHSQTLVLHWLREHGPMTDELLVSIADKVMSPSGARTRRAELVDLGLVVDTGERRVLESGRRAIVWAAK